MKKFGMAIMFVLIGAGVYTLCSQAKIEIRYDNTRSQIDDAILGFDAPSHPDMFGLFGHTTHDGIITNDGNGSGWTNKPATTNFPGGSNGVILIPIPDPEPELHDHIEDQRGKRYDL